MHEDFERMTERVRAFEDRGTVKLGPSEPSRGGANPGSPFAQECTTIPAAATPAGPMASTSKGPYMLRLVSQTPKTTSDQLKATSERLLILW